MLQEDLYERGVPRPPLAPTHDYTESDREAWRTEQQIYYLEVAQTEIATRNTKDFQ
jgi:hypothetical protein